VFVVQSKELCHPTTSEEREYVSSFNFGGVITAEGVQGVEFLTGMFGYDIKVGESYGLVKADGDACEELKEEGRTQVTGKAVIVPRGGCNFYNKTKVLMDAGAAAVIIVNTDETLSRPGIQPKWKGFDLKVPFVLVGQTDGASLMQRIDEEGGELKVKLDLDAKVQAKHWQRLEALVGGYAAEDGGWPSKKRLKKQMYEALKKEWAGGKGAEGRAYKMLLELGKKEGVAAAAEGEL